MRPVPFKESNLNLGAGDNPNTDSMPVAVSHNLEMSDGRDIPFTVSFWKFTEEEQEEAIKNGGVWLANMGYPPSPVLLVAHNPFKHHGYTPYDLTK